MKFKPLYFFIVFTISMVGCKSCLNEDNKIPPNCYDGVLNNGEINIDCGGTNCPECDHCTNGIWEPERGETWLDCGGECAACETCNHGILDGDESAIDCGGSCGGCELLCDDGLLNGFEDDVDCENSTDVQQGGCAFCPTCIDNVMNGDETGIDCGGPDCEPCCSTGNCRNGIQDGEEFYVDCGGNTCTDCPDTLVWKIGGTTYYTPSFLMIFAEAGGSVTFSDNQAFATGNNASPVPQGTLSLMVTEPVLTWANSLNLPLTFPSPLDPSMYAISWTDDAGITYSSSLLDGSGKFTMIKADQVVVPDDDFDGCHKLAGTYTFYRCNFSGTLYSSDPDAPSISVSNGLFQITIYTP